MILQMSLGSFKWQKTVQQQYLLHCTLWTAESPWIETSFMVMSHYRRVVIILEIDVMKSAKDVAGRIGDPVPYTDGKTSKHISYLWLLLTE